MESFYNSLHDNNAVVFYEGSNTVPNCAENVNWYLFTEAHEVSGAVVAKFRDWTNNKGFNNNLKAFEA